MQGSMALSWLQPSMFEKNKGSLPPMRVLTIAFALLVCCGVSGGQQTAGQYLGFDRNEYPGDATLPALRKQFSFVGYWLTNPPRERTNGWVGKREVLIKNGFGFLVLANGREDAKIAAARKATQQTGLVQGQKDGAAAAAAAKREGFPAGAIIFLDQEEGGRLTDDQLGYIRGWTKAIEGAGYKPGVYASGRPVDDGPGAKITTAQDIRARVDSELKEKVVLFVYQDGCPPSNGCTVHPPVLSASGTPDAEIWQYAQSPRQRDRTLACAKTYSADGNCYAPGVAGVYVDLDLAASADPSHGR
jgi:Domain of unknown function (DUF1906)